MKNRTIGIHQRAIAELSNVSISTVSRYIMNNGIQHINEGSQRNLKYDIDSVRRVIENVSAFPKYILRKRQAFYNFKGGTGKTTICFQVASHMALLGYRVLVIDADPQARLSISLGIVDDSRLTLFDLIAHHQPLKSVVLGNI